MQVFQKGPQVTALVANLPGLNVRSCTELRQSLPTVRSRHNDHSRRSTDSRNQRELDFSSDGVSTGHHKSRNRQKHGLQLARSTASLDCKQSLIQSQVQRRRSPRVESTMEHLHKSRKSISQLQSLEFDSEPTYYRLQVFHVYNDICVKLEERERAFDIKLEFFLKVQKFFRSFYI